MVWSCTECERRMMGPKYQWTGFDWEEKKKTACLETHENRHNFIWQENKIRNKEAVGLVGWSFCLCHIYLWQLEVTDVNKNSIQIFACMFLDTQPLKLPRWAVGSTVFSYCILFASFRFESNSRRYWKKWTPVPLAAANFWSEEGELQPEDENLLHGGEDAAEVWRRAGCV